MTILELIVLFPGKATSPDELQEVHELTDQMWSQLLGEVLTRDEIRKRDTCRGMEQ